MVSGRVALINGVMVECSLCSHLCAWDPADDFRQQVLQVWQACNSVWRESLCSCNV